MILPKNNDALLEQINNSTKDRHSLRQIITTLSLVVIMAVFWSLKLTGIGIAGEAFCGHQEHSHDDSCFTRTLICVLEESEPHVHSESCLPRELICQEESETHTHEDSCWSAPPTFGCGLLEADGHTHTEACITESMPFVCGKEAGPGHQHTDDCYKTSGECSIEEHTHTENCYSNINADLETSDDWDKLLADMVRGPTVKENMVLVAKSQLDYKESTLNFQVDAQGIRRGITRYGQWYGSPYGDWSAMFALFCLDYAGAEDIPRNAGPESLRLEWEKAELYEPVEEGTPQIGDLLFLYHEKQTSEESTLPTETDPSLTAEEKPTTANAVAIIIGFDKKTVTVIEGDLNDTVTEVEYELDDKAIVGYGIVPEPDLAVITPESTETTAPSEETEASEVTESSEETVPSEETAPPEELIPSEEVPSSDETQPSQETTPPENTEPADVTAPSTETIPLEAESTADATLPPDVMPLAASYTIWLDGTDGGLGYLSGSPNTAYTYEEGTVIKLPATWTSPNKYSYKLRGWYDVTNSRYYPAGAEMKVTGYAVLYADWVANTYDLGVFNAQVTDTVSTNSFITTHMFDYNYLFNVQSSNPQVTVSRNSHSESWSLVTSGNVRYNNQQTFDFIFSDNDSEGQMNIPKNRDDKNRYHEATTVTSNIYNAQLGDLLFSPYNAFDPQTGTGVLGKTYLGTGDHLLQIMDDPNDEHYGYYYYDSKRNAASYNQSAGRFYVYDYLAATSDSLGGAYSDFLPLNSPYVNTNGKNVGTYTYDGVNGEYRGTTHYRYDSKYNSGDYNSTNNVSTDYAYGMRMDINFYLPNVPGSGGNKDINGNDMQFQFSGDDDLWVLMDGKVILDIGGIHQIVSGTVDFSTGQVVVNGTNQTTLMDLGIGAGDHTLTVLYLERGSSMSNCAIYFNLAPRYSLELRKEDVLTQELLNGAQFTVYEDFECTIPAELWESEAAYRADLADGVLDEHTSTFTVKNGAAKLWGLGSGNTYYIKETAPPGKEGYFAPTGVIRVKLVKEGQATYQIDVIADAEGNEPSKGFTVHDQRIDEETQEVYIVATNAPSSVTETTTVQVIKKWEDDKDHGGDYIQAYLTVTDPDGTVRRIREVTLSNENDWNYLWTNLPKYDYDNLAEVQYGIEESYESGYYSTVRKITELIIDNSRWAESLTFQNGQTYILGTTKGYLSTLDNRADTGYKWVDMETAKTSPNALWTTTVDRSGNVKFTNGVGQTITLYFGPTDFYARIDAPGSNDRQYFSYSNRNGALQIYYRNENTNYYMANSLNNNQKFNYTTSANQSQLFTPMVFIKDQTTIEAEDWAYQITNTPLAASNETSLAVRKEWDIPAGYNETLYQEFNVTVQLMANGVNTGRSITLNLKNNWQGSFLGLPYKDTEGNVIAYTVNEVWKKPQWSTHYGPITTSGGNPPTYSTVITNTYHMAGPELPSTGSAARLMYILCGSGIMLGSLVYGIGSRRKRERRMK